MLSNVALSLLGALALGTSSVGARQLSNSSTPGYQCQEYQVASQNQAGVQKEIDAFLKAIGGVDNANEVGDQRSGFRSINWDGAGLPFVAPPHFFNLEVPRGLQYDSELDFMAASNPAEVSPLSNFGLGDNLLSFFDEDNPNKFRAFSGDRIFCPFDEPWFESTFFEAGTTTSASTSAYGAVALDVDKYDDAYMTFYDKNDEEIYKLEFLPQPGQNQGFSFSGLVCDKPVIHKVEISLGSRLFDVCVDDVFYGEPTGFTYY